MNNVDEKLVPPVEQINEKNMKMTKNDTENNTNFTLELK